MPLRLLILISLFLLGLPGFSLVLKTGISVAESKNDTLWLKPETIVDTELNLAGDQFCGLLSKGSAERLGLPFGSRLLGVITKVQYPRSFQRSAVIDINAYQVLLPDGVRLRVNADLQSRTDGYGVSPIKSSAKALAKEGGSLAASTLVGAVDAVQYTGIATAFISHGISVGAGAAIGFGLGLAGLAREGDDLRSSDFRMLGLKLKNDFQFIRPVSKATGRSAKGKPGAKRKALGAVPLLAAENRLKTASSIELKINKIDKLFSRNYGDLMVLDLNFANRSNRGLFLGDLVLNVNGVHEVLSNPLISSDSLDTVEANSIKSCKLAFGLRDIHTQKDCKLQMLDPVTQELLISLDLETLLKVQ